MSGLFSVFGSLGIVLGMFPVLIILSFFCPLLIKGAVKIGKAKGSYADSFKAWNYSTLPALVISLIPVAGYLAWIYSIVLTVFGVRTLHKTSTELAVWAVLAPFFIIIFIPVVFLIFIIIMFVRYGSIF
ncbi:YIP1 family protein [Candidatus Woesearchaeota archaeon]|nr:YIP1 family protein [Candidatus Woesearchaeota archaeon]